MFFMLHFIFVFCICSVSWESQLCLFSIDPQHPTDRSIPTGRSSLVRAPAQATARIGGAPPVPPDVRGGEELPRAGHRPARPEAAQIRVRRCRTVSATSINSLHRVGMCRSLSGLLAHVASVCVCVCVCFVTAARVRAPDDPFTPQRVIRTRASQRSGARAGNFAKRNVKCDPHCVSTRQRRRRVTRLAHASTCDRNATHANTHTHVRTLVCASYSRLRRSAFARMPGIVCTRALTRLLEHTYADRVPIEWCLYAYVCVCFASVSNASRECVSVGYFVTRTCTA